MIHRRIRQAVLVANVKGPLHFVHMKIGQADFSDYVHADKDIACLERRFQGVLRVGLM